VSLWEISFSCRVAQHESEINTWKNSVIANTPAPSGELQAFDVAAERVCLHSMEGRLDVALVSFRKLYE
jgi:hypothetical protein